MTTTLRYGTSSAAVRVLQQRLAVVGTFKHPTATGYYGSITKAAVAAFERRNGLRVDGVADPAMQALLGKRVAARRQAVVPAADWKRAKAPAHDYRRLTFRGQTVNVRTKQLLLRAEGYLRKLGVRGAIPITQGSYSRGVSASAGTHDGGGALDLRTLGRSSSEVAKMVKALRMAGFAAWSRGPADGFAPHLHAIALGDRQLSPIARAQVAQYFAGRNGLANHGADRDAARSGRPIPDWARRLA